MSWTIHDNRRNGTAAKTVESNASALLDVAAFHNEKIFAVNNNNDRLTYDVLGSAERIWDLYDHTGRIRTYLKNHEAFMVLCANVLDDNVNNDNVWLVNVNDLSERLRWNTEKDWFEIYRV